MPLKSRDGYELARAALKVPVFGLASDFPLLHWFTFGLGFAVPYIVAKWRRCLCSTFLFLLSAGHALLIAELTLGKSRATLASSTIQLAV